MKKTLNRVLVLLMVLALAVSVLPAAVLATGETASVLEGWNIALGENIGVKFYLDSADYTVTTTVSGEEVAPVISDKVVTVNVAAAQMTDTIGLTVKNGEETVHTGEYSVRQYAEAILNGAYDSASKNMVLQMLGYGAAAQSYFGYNPGALANAGYEDQISVAGIPETVEPTVIDGSVAGIKLYGMSLVFESKIAVRFYYSVSGSIDSYTFSDGVNTYEPQQKNGLYYVEVGNINPQDYSNVISMEVSDGENKLSVGYSPVHYIVRMNGKGSANLKTLVQAMYSYHLEAVAYQEAVNATEIVLPKVYDMNVAGNDFAVNNIALGGNLESVTVKNTELVLDNAVLTNNTLTIPAASFRQHTMPSGQLTLVVATDSKTVEITGEFVWVISNWLELTEMDNHFVVDGTAYTGSIAMGADIDATGKTIGNFLWNNDIITYNGTFDGRNHTVSGVNVKANMGLFRDLGADGVIKNLKLTNATVTTNGGALVGGAMYGKLQNVYAQGTITKDGMGESSNLANFGAGLLCGRIYSGAKIDSCIVELTSIADGLRLATAFGKMQQVGATEEKVFTNCYAVNADGCTFMPYKDAEGNWNKTNFAENSANKNFATINDLWADDAASKVAEQIGLVKPVISITLENSFDMNTGSDLVVTDAAMIGTVNKVTVKGTEIALDGAVLANGVLTVPAKAFQQEDMPSGQLTIVVETAGCNYELTGDFVWVINNASDILKMKHHMTTQDETTYYGMLALGADIDLSGVIIKNNGLTGKTFAGSFDGRMYTLSNMSASAGNVGLFGYLSGSVKNLKITGVTVSSNTAAIAGGSFSGSIENVYVQGSVTADGMGANSNLENFGASLLVGRIQENAKISNVIVEVTSIAADLRLATAFGKFHEENVAENSVFSNCYAVNAEGYTFMQYGTWTKVSFTEGGSNKNFADLSALWADADASKLAESFGLESSGPKELSIKLDSAYDMNVAGKDLVIENANLIGNLSSVTIQGTEIALANATLADGVLTIPAASFQLDTMPSGELTLVVTTDKVNCTVTGEFVWVMNSNEELLAMKNHLTADGTVYTGSLALGADITETLAFDANNGLFTTKETFAGTFDGRMYSISEITVSGGNVGLFASVSGTIRNLKVLNSTVSSYTAPLVGGVLTGTIENVYVKGSISKDGMYATSNRNNFGCSLLAARYKHGAKVNNVIVEVTDMKAGLFLATAFGKFADTANPEEVFNNCYAVGVGNAAYMTYNSDYTLTEKLALPGDDNGNYGSLYSLWNTDPAGNARKLAEETFQLVAPAKPTVIVENVGYDMNAGVDFAVANGRFDGTISSVTVQGTEIVLEGATVSNGILTIPAASFVQETMPSGTLTLVVTSDMMDCTITGEFIWVISNWLELTEMDNHFVVDGTAYTGSIAMGADIDATGKTIGNFLWNTGVTNFNGTFDGRNHTVSGVNVKANMGLFRDLGADGVIKNLKLTNATVTTNGGALVGGAMYGKLQNVYAQGTITKDGMGESSNLANFGAGLLCGRIYSGAKIDSCIVELTSIADGLRLATAFGKMQQSGATEAKVFTNCYAVNADGCTFMKYSTWEKLSFTEGGTNANFATMADLWANEAAAALAEALGLTQ